MAIFTVARTLLAGSELRRITLPETVWKFRISSTLGSHKRSRRGQRCHFAALSTINMNAREPSEYFPDSLSSLSFNPKAHEPASAVDIGDRREHDGSPWTLLPNPSKAYAPSATRSTGASTAEPTRSSS